MIIYIYIYIRICLNLKNDGNLYICMFTFAKTKRNAFLYHV